MPRTLVLAWLLLAGQLLAAEIILKNGFTLAADRWERAGEMFRVYRDGGWVEFPAELVSAVDSPASPETGQPAQNLPATGSFCCPAGASLPVRDIIREAAHRYGLPEALLVSVAEVESGLNPSAVSPKGARGVMQLMPQTARALGVNPDDPAANIDAGARLLRELLLRYDGRLFYALAAYHAGLGRMEIYGGLPPIAETLRYIENVVRRYWQLTRGSMKQPSPRH